MTNQTNDLTRMNIKRHVIKRTHCAKLATDTGQRQRRTGMTGDLSFIVRVTCVHKQDRVSRLLFRRI